MLPDPTALAVEEPAPDRPPAAGGDGRFQTLADIVEPLFAGSPLLSAQESSAAKPCQVELELLAGLEGVVDLTVPVEVVGRPAHGRKGRQRRLEGSRQAPPDESGRRGQENQDDQPEKRPGTELL